MSVVILVAELPGYPSVTLTGSIPYGTEFYHDRKGQFSVRAMSGAEYVYDAGFTDTMGILLIRSVSRAEGDALRLWIKNVLNFRENTFFIAPVVGIDMGKGTTVTVSGCRLLKANSQGVLKALPPDNYDVRLEYSCL